MLSKAGTWLFRRLISGSCWAVVFGVANLFVTNRGEGNVDIHIPAEVVNFINWVATQGGGFWFVAYCVAAYVGWFLIVGPKAYSALEHTTMDADKRFVTMTAAGAFAPVVLPAVITYFRCTRYWDKQQQKKV